MRSPSWVLQVSPEDGGYVLQDLATLERIHVDSLDEVSARLERWAEAPPPPSGPAWPPLRRAMPELTRSQARVADLAAAGLTNRQIGAALDIRLRTVESHLTAAYRKLGAGSRGELARIAEMVR